ncbi:MAG: tryptophan synthase subunit alpha [Clostridium sp.]|uniref:tryptophan synthase subunit alpha n=1 Tax=Clostridium sp. TaxID=1506 RepID=UPI003041B13C
MRISDAFKRGKAFIGFITCGDPDLETTEKLIETMEKGGVDLIELGIPFSDPAGEGPVIQGANLRGLDAGITTDKIFQMVGRVRKTVKIPMVFMTYGNVVFSYGIERFIKTCAEIGIQGLILPDVPFEEKEEFSNMCDKYDVDFISLIVPTSGNRISRIAKKGGGFIYCVSPMGAAGIRSSIGADVDSMVALVRAETKVPVALDFGVSTPEQAGYMAKKADGIIVSSAIVKIIEQHGKEAIPKVYEYVKSVRDALDL